MSFDNDPLRPLIKYVNDPMGKGSAEMRKALEKDEYLLGILDGIRHLQKSEELDESGLRLRLRLISRTNFAKFMRSFKSGLNVIA